MFIKNTLYNLLGLGLPLLVAIGTMPVLIHALGDARFGILTLVWAVVSYFGLFDLGLGRALTQHLAVLLVDSHPDRQKEIPPLIFSSLIILLVLGILAGLLIWCGAEAGVHFLSYKGSKQEIIDSMKMMALAMPFILLTSGLRGILEAKMAFGIINLIRLPMGIYTFLGPLGVLLWYGNDLVAITLALTVGRVVGCFVHAYYAMHLIPDMLQKREYTPHLLKNLLISGGWMTVSNIVSPLMGYLDRFLIGITVSAAAVAYYVTPNEILTKLWIIPGALTAVLFPRFAANLLAQSESIRLFWRAVLILFVVLFPITLFISIFAREILGIWIGEEFAKNSYVIMQVFSAGLLVNCLAHVPFTLIQSTGKAKTTAIIHLCEFPFYAAALWVGASKWGLMGAVAAWLIRMFVDTCLMFWQAQRILNVRFHERAMLKLASLSFLVLLGFCATGIASMVVRVLLAALLGMAVLVYCWTGFFGPEERDLVRKNVHRYLPW